MQRVFRQLRKTVGDGTGVTCCGKPFQMRGATTGKTRASDSAGWLSLSARYDGAAPLRKPPPDLRPPGPRTPIVETEMQLYNSNGNRGRYLERA